MGQGVEPLHDLRQVGIVGEQRVASGEDHFRHIRVIRDGIERRVDAAPRGTTRGVGEFAAEAVAAVDGTAARDQQQGPARVFAHEPRRGEDVRLLERVGDEARNRLILDGLWQDLQQQRVSRVAPSHAGREGSGHEQGERCRRLAHRLGEPLVEAEHPAQLARVADRLSQFALPAFRPHRGTVGLRGRDRRCRKRRLHARAAP